MQRVGVDAVLLCSAPNESADGARGFSLVGSEHVGNTRARSVDRIFGTEVERVDGVVAGSERLIELVGRELEWLRIEGAAGKIRDGWIHVVGIQRERELVVEEGFNGCFCGFFLGRIFEGGKRVLGGAKARESCG